MEINSDKVQLVQSGPTLESIIDSIKTDSMKSTRILDSLLLFESSDTSLIPFLDQCYWEFHVRKIKIKEEASNVEGIQTAESDSMMNWQFRQKSVSCKGFQKFQTEINRVTFLDSACDQCFLLVKDPFNQPIVYLTLDRMGWLTLTESYARDNLLGYPREIRKRKLDYLDIKEARALLDALSKVPEKNDYISTDGVSYHFGGCLNHSCFEMGRWGYMQELEKLGKFASRKLGVQALK